ncbi:hypothetical protein DPMN_158497 [Dreissena polymorpha]|uniref:Uncharacterized protein n=1 Tax=Dreissena polymorpha TaxID=45954 RepID=A0A9D4IQX1_DREPO|nr:hypothetical protein DPMN_158497 [Dreissena polymorpha]
MENNFLLLANKLNRKSTDPIRKHTHYPGFCYRPEASRINTSDQHFPNLPCWPPGAPRIFLDVPGPTGIPTAAL